MKIPQRLLPLTTDYNGETLTELLVHQSDNEFAAITAYSPAQIDNGPQTVEYLIRNIICSSVLNGNLSAIAPIYIVRGQFAYGLSNVLKFSLALTIVGSSMATPDNAPKFSYKAKLSLEIDICQLTQRDYITEHVALPHAPSTSDIVEYVETQSECYTFANFYMQSLAEKLILLTNFGSKILGGTMKVARWVAPMLHKVMGTLSEPRTH
ncbi:MAG: hypothetical protein EZS28_033326 [Streblomastix strix]|uniref:Uncharacterized protein n=1 Tax=Streblomastix strix TaxID=222440 RepID=A0A5J4UKF7_9EUKA|nr:MAG: hypothetical protein EZS28_033326 [Streblomastix strix]